jgi:N-acyl-D-amino-acid deacylase
VAWIALGLANSARTQEPWEARSSLSWEGLNAWLKEELPKGFRLVYLHGYNQEGSQRFAARIVKNGKGHEWYWQVGSLEIMQKKDAERRADGFRPICVTGFLESREPRFGIIWVNDGHPVRERIGFHLTEKDYSERMKREAKEGFMPRMVTGCADGAGSYRFTALFVPAGDTLWEEQHDLTDQQYQKAIDEYSGKGFRPSSLTVYPTPAGPRFAVVFLKDGVSWTARHRLSSGQYQSEFDRLAKEGFHPIVLAGYMDSKPAGPETFDQVMRQYMKERSIRAGTLAVSQGGKLLLARGYGFADAEGRRPIEPEDPLRLASLTKSITAAAIHTLIREGKLSLDTKAFPLLGLTPPPGQQPDARLNDITIGHLLEHKGGWDSKQTIDPMFRPLKIAAALKGPGPAGPVDMIRYMIGQPLQFDPGSKTSYSNFGFCVLGRVIEKVSGQTYLAYVQKNIFAPLGARSIELGRSLPPYRNPREPIYFHAGKGRNVLDPESKEEVPEPDGTFYLEAMDAHGGLIASSRDMVRFLDAYWISGEPRQGNGRTYVFFGQLSGTFTMAMQRPNGVNIAAFFNQDADPSGLDYFALRDRMREVADRQTSGGWRYAAVWVKGE